MSAARLDGAAAATRLLSRLLGRRVETHTLDDVLLSDPAYPSLLSISDAFSAIGIEHDALQVGPGALAKLPTPHLAYWAKDFVVVTRVGPEAVTIGDGVDAPRTLPLDEYLSGWSGEVLVPTGVRPTMHAPAPRPRRVPLTVLGVVAAVLLAGLAAVAWPHTSQVRSLGLFGLLSLVGLWLSRSLLAEELGLWTAAQSVCRMSPRASCESVLSSSAAKLGPISMADVGFGYFAGGLVVSCMVPAVQGGTVAVLSVLRWLSVLALPYTLFSIGFQALRARLWCPLCVLVQAVLWAQAVALLEVPLAWHVSSSAVWVTLALFPLPGLAWLAIKPSVEAGVEARTRRIQLERLLRDPAILSARIGREAPIPLPPLPLEVTRGPASAPLTVTLYTDPTCPHCAVRHREALEALSRADGALRAVVRLQGPMTADPRAVALLATVAEHLERGAEAEAYELVDRWYTGDRSALTLIQSDALTANARARFESHRERMRPPPFDAVPRIFVGDRPWPAELSLRYIGYLARALAEAAST